MNKKVLLSILFVTIASLTLVNCNKDGEEETEEPKTDLELAKEAYETRYLGTQVSDLGWTGSIANCNAGVIYADAQQKVIERVNYYRALVGLPDNITLNTSQSQKCQEAALYMIANQTLTHYPSNGNSCYTQGAADAAGHGNIAISSGYQFEQANHSVNAVSGYIEDPGANNLAVGHRAWILYPQLSALGSGSVWDPNGNWAADCMMWGNNMNGSAPTIDFVAYPPANYIPSTLLFPRWSFSIQGANFTSADVEMTNAAGDYINCNIIHQSAQQGAPDARIAWEPQISAISPNEEVTEFNVTVNNVQNAPKTSYSYTVKVFYVEPLAKASPNKDAFKKILGL